MPATLHTRRPPAAQYTRTATRDVLVADALGCVITGRALPDRLRPTHRAPARPATVPAGVARILTWPGGM